MLLQSVNIKKNFVGKEDINMELQLRNCIIIGILFMLVSFLFFLLKKIKIVVILAVIAFLFFTRSGIVYMAMNYEPPKIELQKVKEIEVELPEVDLDIKLPDIKYKDSGAKGFGLDYLDKND